MSTINLFVKAIESGSLVVFDNKDDRYQENFPQSPTQLIEKYINTLGESEHMHIYTKQALPSVFARTMAKKAYDKGAMVTYHVA